MISFFPEILPPTISKEANELFVYVRAKSLNVVPGWYLNKFKGLTVSS